MKKLFAILLSFAMILSLLTGCQVTDAPGGMPDTQPSVSAAVATTQIKDYEKHLQYTLSDEDSQKFYDTLQRLEDYLLAGEDWELAQQLNDALDELAYYFNDQQSIAYILMSIYGDDETYSNYYTDSTAVWADMVTAYKETAKRVYHSDSALKDEYFADWTENEIREMINYTEEVADLEKRNAQILVEFRALDEATMQQDMIPLYRELVLNNNRIAQLAGYNNYYEYAYELRYSRDYGPEQAQVVRDYVAQHIAPAFTGVFNKTVAKIGELDDKRIEVVRQLLFQQVFDTLSVNYVDDYICTLPQTAKASMQGMFLNSRSIFPKEVQAHESAFTVSVADGMLCYFGPGYQGTYTVIHELGHYYALEEFLEVNPDVNAISLDLAEVHSQGNEWLFTGYLKDILDEETYNAIVYYRMYEYIAGILVQVCVDAFEQQVYTHPDIANMTEADFEALMVQVCRDYGGIDFINSHITDIQWYWRMVVLESPVYYISYAVSGMAALDLFFACQEDYDAAMQMYCSLVEQVDEEGGFLTNLQRVGMHGPFDEDVYIALAALAK